MQRLCPLQLTIHPLLSAGPDVVTSQVKYTSSDSENLHTKCPFTSKKAISSTFFFPSSACPDYRKKSFAIHHFTSAVLSSPALPSTQNNIFPTCQIYFHDKIICHFKPFRTFVSQSALSLSLSTLC